MERIFGLAASAIVAASGQSLDPATLIWLMQAAYTGTHRLAKYARERRAAS